MIGETQTASCFLSNKITVLYKKKTNIITAEEYQLMNSVNTLSIYVCTYTVLTYR